MSSSLLWNGLEVCSEICPPPLDRISYPSLETHCISLHVTNTDKLERRLDGGKLESKVTYPGTLTFIPGGQSPEWLWISEVELLEIYVPPSVLEKTAIETFNSAWERVELIDRFGIFDPFLEQIALALKAELNGTGAQCRVYLESLQTVLAVHLLRNHCCVKVSRDVISGGLSRSKLKQVFDYIEEYLERDIGLIELAELVKVSPHHFGKLFKQSTGLSPHKYVLKCRIERAKQLLANADKSLAEVSLAAGFYDQSHFTNVFRRYTNLTPRQYRSRL